MKLISVILKVLKFDKLISVKEEQSQNINLVLLILLMFKLDKSILVNNSHL